MSVKGGILVLDSPLLCLVRLSLRLSRSDFSPRTAPVLARLPPDGLDPGVADSGGCAVELDELDVSTLRPACAARFACCRSSSTQSAGVGGTGPSAVIPFGGGLLVGGDRTGLGSIVRFKLCDLEFDGGGPGGGGGRGNPGPHRD